MSIKTIFETMDYGTAPEDSSEALNWIVGQGGAVGSFIAGGWSKKRSDMLVNNPATGEKLADMTIATPGEVKAAVGAARKAQPDWAALGGPARARVLYAIARLMQKMPASLQ